jgi:hypothetical protein
MTCKLTSKQSLRSFKQLEITNTIGGVTTKCAKLLIHN